MFINHICIYINRWLLLPSIPRQEKTSVLLLPRHLQVFSVCSFCSGSKLQSNNCRFQRHPTITVKLAFFCSRTTKTQLEASDKKHPCGFWCSLRNTEFAWFWMIKIGKEHLCIFLVINCTGCCSLYPYM